MECDADPMADGAAQHEKMPYEMHVRDFVHDKEDDADRVGNAFREKDHETRVAERLTELRKGEDDHPAHNEIDGQRQNVGPFGRAQT